MHDEKVRPNAEYSLHAHSVTTRLPPWRAAGNTPFHALHSLHGLPRWLSGLAHCNKCDNPVVFFVGATAMTQWSKA